jgi:hypothetical protein
MPAKALALLKAIKPPASFFSFQLAAAIRLAGHISFHAWKGDMNNGEREVRLNLNFIQMI